MKEVDLCSKITINLGAIRRNYLTIAEKLGSGVICSAVLKDDSYGLGAKQVAQVLYQAGCRDFWTAYFKEALILREFLPFDAHLYFLQGFDKSGLKEMERLKITPVLNCLDELEGIADSNQKVVLHFDTGLTRLGFREEDLEVISAKNRNLNVKYVISHLSCPENIEDPFNWEQKTRFDRLLIKIKKNFPTTKIGLSASFGLFIDQGFAYDLVRLGGYLYGISSNNYKSENVLNLSSVVLQRYQVSPGTKIGYGATYTTDSKKTVAVISIGYADGIKRSLANRGKVLFYDESGQQFTAPILGAISMDLLVCDVSAVPPHLTEVHKKAFLIDNQYSINEMAQDAGTSPYEILTNLNYQPPRIKVVYSDHPN